MVLDRRLQFTESALEIFKFRMNLDTVFQDDLQVFIAISSVFKSTGFQAQMSQIPLASSGSQQIPFGIALFLDNVIRMCHYYTVSLRSEQLTAIYGGSDRLQSTTYQALYQHESSSHIPWRFAGN